jgi:hypothetical protein
MLGHISCLAPNQHGLLIIVVCPIIGMDTGVDLTPRRLCR